MRSAGRCGNLRPFARPILKHLRKVGHAGCPDVVETLQTAPTRTRRLETTVTWLSEGKGRNWKYER